ncbi:MAG TPA: nuclease [Caulobacteraceae bacterium]|nr:nuclease [Caulobacteraceae bacterium]
MRYAAAAIFTAAFWCVAGAAAADTCEAPVNQLEKGQTFAGTVRYVADGDTLCVGNHSDPATWIKVRLADFYAPELSEPEGRQAKAALEAIAMGQSASCVAQFRSLDRIVARCSVRGRSIGDQMRAAGAPEDSPW